MSRNAFTAAVVTITALVAVVVIAIVNGAVPAELWPILAAAVGGFYGASVPPGSILPGGSGQQDDPPARHAADE